ncbi:beta/gamma crystallin-related protein [Planktothrix sp. FACHB-1365]|uniref:beta/gamma crystallin-related protein n=1 Tax=Planktothrix sp. FACHB-1365 TaxID=2692855 RepID=UPI001686D371|nr:beta/gamma crystallin-related protein [Planktothrix sp. FACHB-1365]MBD2483828.1 beta/gamma crystallin family protein [Planktothrix sp. FACHB-1365]
MASLVLFEHENFGGNSITIENDTSNLSDLGWNDKTSSVKIMSGEWQLWSNADFNGVALQLTPGDYPKLTEIDGRFNDVISSVKAFVG